MIEAISNNWRTLERPRAVERASRSNNRHGKFVIRPLERGFGTTLGNGLRRILLSTLQGAAIRTVRFTGLPEGADTIVGVVEDITDLQLNFKGVRFRTTATEPIAGRVKKTAAVGETVQVVAGDIEFDGDIQVLNPEHVLGTVTEGGTLAAEIRVEMGSGYNGATNAPSTEPGTFTLDALHSPVEKVRYVVTNARKGQRTDYDRLALEIWTDGSVRPEDALTWSARIFREQMQVFIDFEEEPEPVAFEEAGHSDFPPELSLPVGELELSVRSANCLKNANIEYVWQLVEKSEAEMLKIKNLGRKSLNEIKDLMTDCGLQMGMDLTGFNKNV